MSIEKPIDFIVEKGNENQNKNTNENDKKTIDPVISEDQFPNTELNHQDKFKNIKEIEVIEKSSVVLEEYRILNKNHFHNVNLNFDRKELDNIENIQIAYKDGTENEEINYSNNLNDFNKMILSKKDTIKNQKYLYHLTRHFDKQSNKACFSNRSDQFSLNKLCDNDENMFSVIASENCSHDVLYHSNNISFEEKSKINNLGIEEIQDNSSQNLKCFNEKTIIGNIFANQSETTTNGFIMNTDGIREHNDVEEPIIMIQNPNNCNLYLKNENNLDQVIKDTEIIKNEFKIFENDINIEDINKHSNFPESPFNKRHSFKIDNFNFYLGENKIHNNNQSSFNKQKRMKVIIENKINIDITKDSDKIKNNKSIVNTKKSLTERKFSTENFPNKDAMTSKYKLTFINDKNNNMLTTNSFYPSRNKDYTNSPLSIYFSNKNYIPTSNRSDRVLRVGPTKLNLTKKPKLFYNPKKKGNFYLKKI
jgi:hypothetical protein